MVPSRFFAAGLMLHFSPCRTRALVFSFARSRSPPASASRRRYFAQPVCHTALLAGHADATYAQGADVRLMAPYAASARQRPLMPLAAACPPNYAAQSLVYGQITFLHCASTPVRLA